MSRVAGEGGGRGTRGDQRKVTGSGDALDALGVLVGRVAHGAGRGEASDRKESNGGTHVVLCMWFCGLFGYVKRWIELGC